MNKLIKSLLLIFAFTTTSVLFAQNLTVSGEVTASDDKLPMMGVNVIVSGAAGQGTITDMDGKYTISVPAGRSLTFRYIGYKETTITINRSGVFNVILDPDTKMLDEVVAIGYGTMKKSDLTGSVTSIKAEALQRTPAAGIDQALQGRAAGVTVNANSGQPGAQAEIRIRGIGTVNNSAPIFVVDGTIVDNISFLSPNDIESTEILKDASATAIYGSRGANGVILVTTKKGKEGKSNISLNAYFGVQNRWRKLDLMQSEEFAKTIIALNNVASERNYFRNNGFNKWLTAYRLGRSPYYPTVKTDTNPAGFDYESVETDWQEEVFNANAAIQNYHLSIDGGTDKGNYVISASYFNQEGTIIGSNFERFTLRLNSAHKVRSWLKVGENLSFMSSTGRNAMNNNSSPGASILSAALAMAPWDPTHYPAGSVNIDGKDLGGQIAASSNFRNVTNPFSMVENSAPSNNVERWVGDIYAEITPIKDLVLRSSVSMDLSNNRDKLFKYAYEYSSYDKADRNFIANSMARYSTLIFENILTYQKDFDKHSISLMAGQTTQEFNYSFIGGSGAAILNPAPNNWFISQATLDKTYANDGASRTRMFSLLSRAHYTYDNKYMATLNFRADASSKFPENIWGYFPSMAFAWRISEEDWMKEIPNMDFMKVRAGWGQIGNDKIAADNFILKMFNSGPTFVDYVLGPNQQLAGGAAVLTFVNQGGRWETTEQFNAGVDFGFFNGLLAGNVDFFVRDTKEMLLSVKAPAHVGNRYDPVANVGMVRNQGVEITLDHQHKIGKLNYNVSGNVSFIKNELTSLNGGDRVYGDKNISDEGYPLFTLWGYKYEGIYQSDADALQHLFAYTPQSIPYHAGDARFTDLNNDGKIDDADKMDIGNPFPWLTYGLNAGASYLGFDFQVFFQGVAGNELYNAVRHRTEGKGVEATLGTQMRNVWTTANPYGDIPNPYGSSMNFETSGRFVESGSYLRLKNLQLGYTLPKTILEGTFINRCRFYLSANNLLTLTGYTGYDPEVGGGVDYGNYPQARTMMFGVNLDF
jgi:TonB-dependent starch-binding outer membrane protein SusC